MFKISSLRPLQSFAEHKFSQVAGEVFGARNRLNARRTTPRPVRSNFKNFSHGTTPTARGVCFLGPGGRRHALGTLRHERTLCRRVHCRQRGRFSAVFLCSSIVHPLFILCTTATLHANGTPEERRSLCGALAPSKAEAKEPLHTQSLVTQAIAPTVKRQGAGVAEWSGMPKISRSTAIAYSTRILRDRERIRAVFRNTRGVTEYPSTLLTPNLCKYIN